MKRGTSVWYSQWYPMSTMRPPAGTRCVCHVVVIFIKLVLLGLIVKRRVTFFVKPHGTHTHTNTHFPHTDTHTHTDTHSHTQTGTHKKVIRIWCQERNYWITLHTHANTNTHTYTQTDTGTSTDIHSGPTRKKVKVARWRLYVVILCNIKWQLVNV